MKQNDDDTPTAREIKQAISENLQMRYSSDPGLEDFIHKCTALDPCFKTLHLDPAYQQRIYEDILITEVVSTAQQVCIIYLYTLFHYNILMLLKCSLN